MKYILCMLFAIMIAVVPGCTITQPDLYITGERTIIERQITGEYRELEEDAWIISSARTNAERVEASFRGTGNEEIFSAMNIRESQSGKIRNYKSEGCLGERNDGFLSYIETDKYERDSNLKKVLESVLDKENNARKKIFINIMIKSGVAKPGEADILSFGRSFAEEQRKLAEKNDWIQDESGKWERKK